MAGETVLVRALGGTWGQIGAEYAPGVVPESIVASVNHKGPDTASFIVRRDPSVQWPDLREGNPVDISRYGKGGWAGYIDSVSGDAGEGQIIVQCKGAQHHGDHDLIRPFYVQRKLTDWKDWRSNLGADLGTFVVAGQTEVGEGGLIFSHPAGSVAANNMAYFDAGPGNLVKRVVIAWSKNFSGNNALYFRRGNSVADMNSGTGLSTINNATGAQSGTYALTLATPSRYVGIRMDSNGYTRSNDESCKISAALLFGETAYESGNESDFTLDELVKHVRDNGTDLWSDSDEHIEAFSYGIPELAPKERRTPNELIELGQAFHDVRLGVDAEWKVVAQMRPSAPEIKVGSWTRRDFKDGALSLDSLVSGVVVEGQSSSAEQLEVERDSQDVNANLVTIPERQGFTKRIAIPVQSTLTTALGERMGDVYLGTHITSPFKGEQVVQGYGDLRTVLGDAPVHAFDALLHWEKLLRFDQLIDPDTGGIGRDGRMKSITYNGDTEESTIAIDNESRSFEALAARATALGG